ncbi:DUF6868 family protein [Variovorax sp. HW608]
MGSDCLAALRRHSLAGMASYKVGILLFNLIPYVALRIVESHGGQV